MDLTAAPVTGGGGGCGVVAMDGLVAASPSEVAPTFFTSDESEEQDWRLMKMTRTESFLPPKSSLLRSSPHSLFPDGQQMLSFSQSPASSSPPKQEALLLCSDGTLPYYHLSSSTPMSSSPAAASFVRTSGMVGSGSLNMNLHGPILGAKGYFTPSQWVELEHQAMIYKCLDANVPIPPSLLISIRKSLYPSGYTAYSAGSIRPGTYGWGSFQLGFSGSTDPEPGRCRRTDGKKWRCTRDAVADQKYCERHLNRGRHRSRKPVEGQTGHAKAMTVIARSPASLAVSGSGSSNCSIASQKTSKSFQPTSTDPSPAPFNRISTNKESVNDPQKLPFATAVNAKHGNAPYPILKQHNPFEQTSPITDFGLNCTSSLLNPSRTSYLDSGSFGPSSDLKDQSYPLRSFMEEWPNSQSDRMTVSWPETEDDPLARTQLSISISNTADIPSSSSPTHDKMNYSTLKQLQEFDPTHMGLGVGIIASDMVQKQHNMVPSSWEASMGGPLGEVLNSTLKDNFKNSSLNLARTGWDSCPPESSPTGVLQKTAFCSLSSSTGSSPTIENYKSHESTGSLHDHLLGSTLFNHATIPSL